MMAIHRLGGEFRKHALVIVLIHLALPLCVLWMYALPARSLLQSWGQAQAASLYKPALEDLLSWYGEDLQALSLDFSANYAMSLLGSTAIGVLLMGVIGAHVAGSEFHWRTLGCQVAHTSRRQFLGSKIALLGLSALTLILVIVVLSAVASALASSRITKQIAMDGLFFPPSDTMAILPQIVLTWLCLMLFGLSALTCTLVTGQTIIGLLVFLVLWFGQLILAGYLQQGPATLLLPAAAQQSLVYHAFAYLPYGSIVHEPLVNPIAGPTSAVVITAAMTLVITVVAVMNSSNSGRYANDNSLSPE